MSDLEAPELVLDAAILVVNHLSLRDRLALALASTFWNSVVFQAFTLEFFNDLFNASTWLPGFLICGKPWSEKSTNCVAKSLDGRLVDVDLRGLSIGRSSLSQIILELVGDLSPRVLALFYRHFMSPCPQCFEKRGTYLPLVVPAIISEPPGQAFESEAARTFLKDEKRDSELLDRKLRIDFVLSTLGQFRYYESDLRKSGPNGSWNSSGGPPTLWVVGPRGPPEYFRSTCPRNFEDIPIATQEELETLKTRLKTGEVKGAIRLPLKHQPPSEVHTLGCEDIESHLNHHGLIRTRKVGGITVISGDYTPLELSQDPKSISRKIMTWMNPKDEAFLSSQAPPKWVSCSPLRFVEAYDGLGVTYYIINREENVSTANYDSY